MAEIEPRPRRAPTAALQRYVHIDRAIVRELNRGATTSSMLSAKAARVLSAIVDYEMDLSETPGQTELAIDLSIRTLTARMVLRRNLKGLIASGLIQCDGGGIRPTVAGLGAVAVKGTRAYPQSKLRALMINEAGAL